MIALDMLLAQGRNDRKETVAKRFPAIMYHDYPNDIILKAYAEIKDYYALRNEIMHVGQIYIEEETLKQIRVWTHSIILLILEHRGNYMIIGELQEMEFPIDMKIFHSSNDIDMEI
jgi:hypothetical protein